MDHIRSLIPKVLEKRGIRGQADAALVIHHAMMWLHERFAPAFEEGQIRVVHYKDGELLISTHHSIVAQECHEASEALLAYLRKDCGHTGIQKIRVQRA